jgi:hypothetical protein
MLLNLPDNTVLALDDVMVFQVGYAEDRTSDDSLDGVKTVLIKRDDEAQKLNEWYYDNIIFNWFNNHTDVEVKFINQIGRDYDLQT